MPFVFNPTDISGVFLVQPRVFPDDRGFFMETYKASDFEKCGIVGSFVQDNHSKSSKGVLRGLHFQREPHAQGKLVRVTEGSVWDVAVDIRPDSSSYLTWIGFELSAENAHMLFLPPGCAHGFLTLTEFAQVQYKCTVEYNKESEGGIRWDDPDLAIEWPIKDVLVSEKDKILPFVKDISFK